jgi:hypothetical protein
MQINRRRQIMAKHENCQNIFIFLQIPFAFEIGSFYTGESVEEEVFYIS